MGIIARIQELCDKDGISINKLEQITDVGRGSIARWEMHDPSAKKVKAVADYFGVSSDYLLTGETAPDEVTELLEELRGRSEMRMLFSITKNATKEDIEKAVKIIEALRSDN